MERAQAYHGSPSAGSVHVLLVIIALLCGAAAGLAAFGLANKGNARNAILYGFGVFGATTLFVIQVESALGLLN